MREREASTMTPQQLFKAACNEAMSKLRSEPVEKVLRRLPHDELMAIQHALAQHFRSTCRRVTPLTCGGRGRASASDPYGVETVLMIRPVSSYVMIH
jgi:hypothetical protein